MLRLLIIISLALCGKFSNAVDHHYNRDQRSEQTDRGEKYNYRDRNRQQQPELNEHEKLLTCVFKTATLGYDYLNDQPKFDTADLILVNDYAELEIIQYEPVYYNRDSEDGVRVRVISNPQSKHCLYSHCAQPGDILWYYKLLFANVCR
ncbi:MAG: hypothetical protein ABL927_10755 [Bdellovibrionales bacterium]